MSNYNALQLVAKRNLTHGLGADINHTWSHSLTDVPPSDARNLVRGDPSYEYRNSAPDVRHRVAGTITFEVPFGKNLHGIARALGNGWQANALRFWESGTVPFAVVDGSPAINLPGISSDRPNRYRRSQFSALFPTGNTTDYCYQSFCYFAQTPGTAGNEGANQVYGPTDRRLDLSLFKSFKITETSALQFRAEMFNVTNTANFLLPNHSINASGFGLITATNDAEFPREAQFALRYQF